MHGRLTRHRHLVKGDDDSSKRQAHEAKPGGNSVPVPKIMPQHRCRAAPDSFGAVARSYFANVQKMRGVARQLVPKDDGSNDAGPARDPPNRGKPNSPLVTAMSSTTTLPATVPRLDP